ncbi:MAG TPA: LPS assembly protein LptD [Candidatus Brocadiaceae bacterium]|nr:LPS assembly protein LptD [Candidatus Brocadiaceae bacterium]
MTDARHFGLFHTRITRVLIILMVSFILAGSAYADRLLSEKNIAQRPFSLKANNISTWEKDGIRVFVASDEAKIMQGPFQIVADTIVCWFHEEEALQHTEATVEMYCEGNITIFQDTNYEKYVQVYLRSETMTGVVIDCPIQPIETLETAKDLDVLLRGEAIRSMGKEEYLSTVMSQQDLKTAASSKGELIDVIADNIDSWKEGNRRIVVAIGNVKIKKGDLAVDADSVILYFDEKESGGQKKSELLLSEVYAEGNVTMRHKKDVQVADKIFENIVEDRGIYINTQMKTVIEPSKKQPAPASDGTTRQKQKQAPAGAEDMPVYITGEEIIHTGKGQYEAKNGTMSTCGYGHPHYHFEGQKIRLIQRENHNVFSSSHNTVYFGKYPVAYFPFISLDVEKDSELLKYWEVGGSSRLGSFIRTDWDVFDVTGGKQKEWSSLTLKLDYMTKRGAGGGLNFGYHDKEDTTSGFIDTYYLNDQGDYDINNIPIDDDNRGKILWRHRQEMPDDWRLDAEYSYLSDPRFLREFYEDEFKTEKDRETVLYARRLYETSAVTFSVNEQMNSFDTTVDSLREKKYVERLPEASYRIIGEPILDNRLIFTSESYMTYLNGILEQTPQTVKPQPVTRIDTSGRVGMPFKPWVFNINPFVEGRATGYTESVDTSGATDEANGPPTGRFIGTMGIDWSSTHWRNYSVYNDFLKINRLRHVFVPEVRYLYSPLVTKDPNALYQYDAIDALDSSQVVVVGVKNKLQTKRGEPGYEKSVDILEFNIDYYAFPGNAGIYNDGINGITVREDDFINLDFKSQLTDVVSFISERNEFNVEKFQMDVFNAGFSIYNPPGWEYFIGNRYIVNSSDSLILGANYNISEKWSVLASENFLLDSETVVNGQRVDSGPGNFGTNIVLSHYFHDWIGNIVLKLDPVRNDNTYSFDVVPKGAPRTYRRFWF